MLPLRPPHAIPNHCQRRQIGRISIHELSSLSPLLALSFYILNTFLLATVTKLLLSLLHVSSSPSIVSESRPVRYCVFAASLWHYRLQGLSKSFLIGQLPPLAFILFLILSRLHSQHMSARNSELVLSLLHVSSSPSIVSVY